MIETDIGYFKVTDYLYVSNRDYCNSNYQDFTHIIHIWREDNPDISCKFNSSSESMRFKYKDGDPLSTNQLNELHAFFMIFDQCKDPNKKLLIHCAAGICRSPTLAIFALLVLEAPMSLGKAVGIVVDGEWTRKLFPNLVWRPMTDIANYMGGK